MAKTTPRKNKYRIVNLSSTNIQPDNLLEVPNNKLDEIFSLLRTHVDCPYIWLTDSKNHHLASELLKQLRSIRSCSYPHALFTTDDLGDFSAPELDVIPIISKSPEQIVQAIDEFAEEKFFFDKNRLALTNKNALPTQVDVVIIGAGITGLYAARKLEENKISCCVIEAKEIVGGIWSSYANTTSQVNTSEGAYRVLEKKSRNNRDHSSTGEILEDLWKLSQSISPHLYTGTKATGIIKKDGQYMTTVVKEGQTFIISSKGAIVAVNDRVGSPRLLSWENQSQFKGLIVSGTSDEALRLEWQGKDVVIVGMGAFAVENTRTALENGARQVHVVCRRHGTVCPKIIDYLNFSTPYNENFEHDKKSNIRNMMLWKRLYDISGATEPECWMGKLKHRGHTISVSDIWFIAHHLNKLKTHTGAISAMYEKGVIVNHETKIPADIVVNCIGFHRNAESVRDLTGYSETYNNNYLDKDLMYLADAFIDDDVFNSFFGSSVLEMTKFYMDVYIHFFDNPAYEKMITSEGIESLAIDQRSWSHYITGAESLMKNYPVFKRAAQRQIERRTANFLESHDLETYIRQNRREWFETHSLLSGTDLPEEKCLPYVFDKLLEKKI